MKDLIPVIMFLYAAILGNTNAVAQEQDSLKTKTEWGVEYTTELQFTNEGKCNFVNLLRLQASIPIVKSLSLDVASISTYMTSSESIGGDMQVFSNLDADNIAFALAVCGVNMNLGKHHSVFLGIRNMNEDYFASELTTFFTNSSCGIHPTIGCNYPIANYPVASVGAHYRFEAQGINNKDDVFACQASVYNGTGYNRFSGRENVFRFCPKSDGIFGLAQMEYQHKCSSYFFGVSGYLPPSSSAREYLQCSLWTYGEQRLTDALFLIAAYSHAFASDAECTDFAGIGGRYSWQRCELGFFTDYARFASTGKQGRCWENATEVTCKVQLTSRIYMQPAAHLVISHPDANEGGVFRAMGLLRFGLAL